MYDIIVIGAGAAGLTSAIYGRRALKSVLVLEALACGGQIINTLSIENYPGMPYVSGFDFANSLYNQAKELGADIKYEKVIKLKDGKTKIVVTDSNSYKAKAVIIATGCSSRHLGVPREDEFASKGVSYCATCDGNLYKGKNVAVVGGGNSALDDALYLSDIAKKVYLIHRKDTFSGEEAIVKTLEDKDNVEFVLEASVTELIGDKKLEKIVVTGKRELEVSGLFVAIGKVPQNDIFVNLIELDAHGYVKSSENCHTNVDGIFVAGDNRAKKLRQLVTATSDGAMAMTEALKYLSKGEL